MKRVAITTLGCKANWSDAEAIAQHLAAAGLKIVDFDSEADIYIVNTCTVTSLASSQSRQMLRKARRRAPGVMVLASGCLCQIDPEDVSHIEGVDALFGTSDRAELIDFVCRKCGVESKLTGLRGDSFDIVARSMQSRSRAFVKIQDGCNKGCSYCIIPRARGGSRSMPVRDVLSICAELSLAHREIILTGIDIGQYGKDLISPVSLVDLIMELVGLKGMARLRISSLGPKQVDEGLIQFMNGGSVCRHLHLSIQSGCDSVIARMKRGYVADDIKSVVMEMTGSVDGIAVTGDVITGFPGETEEEHRQTVRLLSDLPLAGLHVFPYSERSGTQAASMQGQVPHPERRRRAAEIRQLANLARQRFLAGLIGKPIDVIVTTRAEQGLVVAVADNGVKIALPAGRCAYGGLAKAVINEVSGLSARGVWV